jgi:hypothetical protein
MSRWPFWTCDIDAQQHGSTLRNGVMKLSKAGLWQGLMIVWCAIRILRRGQFDSGSRPADTTSNAQQPTNNTWGSITLGDDSAEYDVCGYMQNCIIK